MYSLFTIIKLIWNHWTNFTKSCLWSSCIGAVIVVAIIVEPRVVTCLRPAYVSGFLVVQIWNRQFHTILRLLVLVYVGCYSKLQVTLGPNGEPPGIALHDSSISLADSVRQSFSIPFPFAGNLDCTPPVLEGSKPLTETVDECCWDCAAGTVSWSA